MGDKVHTETVEREAKERQKFEEDRQVKIGKELTNLRVKQKKEHEGFLRTEQRILDEMNKKFSNEKKKLIQKYNNLKNELDVYQKQQITKFEGRVKNADLGSCKLSPSK